MKKTSIAFLTLCILIGGAPRPVLAADKSPKAPKKPVGEAPDKRSDVGFNEDASKKYRKVKKEIEDFRMSSENLDGKMSSGDYQEKDLPVENPEMAARKKEAHRIADLGWERIERHDFAGALKLLREAEKLYADARVIMRLSIALDHSGDVKGALAKLTEGAKRDPKHRINYISTRVALYTKLGMYDEALKDSKESLAYNNTIPSYWGNHARLLAKMKRYANAGEAYQKSANLEKKGGPGFLRDRDLCRDLKAHGVMPDICGIILSRAQRRRPE